MWKPMLHTLLGPIASAWLYSRIRHDGEMTFPTDAPVSHGSGPDPDRVLLVGGSVVGGAGVASYDLALGGRLARKLATRTGRGADLETRSAYRYDTSVAADLLRADTLDRFDAVVIVIGVREVMRMRPTALWRRDIDRLLDAIREIAPPTLPVLLVGISAFGRDVDVPPFVVEWLDQTVEKHNGETREACEASGIAEYVPFTPSRNGIRSGRDASRVYESWAEALAPALDRVLALTQPIHHGDGGDDESRRQAVLALGVLDRPVDPQIDHIVQMARGMLGMSAALSIVDEQLHVVSASGVQVGVLPKRDGFTHLTVESPGVLVIEDADGHPAIHQEVREPGGEIMRFYAGYPIEAPGGQRIGALCVTDSEPREFSVDEISLLRDLALRAQAVLWRASDGS